MLLGWSSATSSAFEPTDRLPLQLARLAGLAPFTFGESEPRRATYLRWYSVLVTVLSTATLCVFAYLESVNPMRPDLLPIERVSIVLRYAINVAGAVVADVFLVLRQHGRLADVLDKSLVRAYLWRPSAWCAMLPTCVEALVLVWKIFWSIFMTDHPLFILITTVMAFKDTILSVELALFVFLLDTVSHRYDDLNGELKRLPKVRMAAGDSVRHLVQVRRQHKEATDLLEQLCFIFGPQVAVTLLARGGFAVLSMYLLSNQQVRPMWALFFYSTFPVSLINYALALLQVLWIADRTCEKGNRAMHYLHKLQNDSDVTEDEYVQLSLFCSQLSDFPVQVSLCRLMNLNFRGTLKAANSIVTFFIAFLQFRDT